MRIPIAYRNFRRQLGSVWLFYESKIVSPESTEIPNFLCECQVEGEVTIESEPIIFLSLLGLKTFQARP